MSDTVLMSKASLVPQVLLGGVTVCLFTFAVIVTLEETLVVAGIMGLATALVALDWSGIQALYLSIDESGRQLEVHFRHHLLTRAVDFAQVKAVRLEFPRRVALGYGLHYDLRGGEWYINSDRKQFICFELERGQKLYIQCGNALELDSFVSRLERMMGLA